MSAGQHSLLQSQPYIPGSPCQLLLSSSHLEGTSHLPADTLQGLSLCVGVAWAPGFFRDAGPQRPPSVHCLALCFPRDLGNLVGAIKHQRAGLRGPGQQGLIDTSLAEKKPRRNSLWAGGSPGLQAPSGQAPCLSCSLSEPQHLEHCQAHASSLTDLQPMQQCPLL